MSKQLPTREEDLEFFMLFVPLSSQLLENRGQVVLSSLIP
jgi:hypothetical protein